MCFAVALCASLVIALAPYPVQANCTHWSMGGHWKLVQDDGIEVTMNLFQKGTNVSGTASFYAKVEPYGGNGTVRGTVDGNNFDLRVVWEAGNVGHWKGTINAVNCQGISTDERVHAYYKPFNSDRPMVCTDGDESKTLVKRAPEQLPGYIRIKKSCPVTVNYPGRVHFGTTLDVGDQYPLVSRKGDIVTLKYTTDGTVDVPVLAVDLPNSGPNKVLPLPKAQGATPGSTPEPPRFKPVKKLKITPTT